MSYFFMKLTPPRATFPNDASAEEITAMAEHAKYMGDLVTQGRILAAGPVREGEGSWGLAIGVAKSEDELNELCQKDPAIAASLGFKWTFFPMGSLLHKQTV